jgi:hypothetical protein
MDGKALLYELRNALNEDSDSGFLDNRTSYSYLNEAASEFVSRAKCLKATQAITTEEDTAGYTLNADFLELYLKDEQNNLFIKYNDGNTDTFIKWKDYEDIIYANNTTSTSIPGNFTFIDDPTLDSQITGTATSAGAASAGKSALADTAADFSDASAGDIVHNTTDDSDGIILSKTSSTELVTALFGGTNNDWRSSDVYVIQPQGRIQLILDPPPDTAGHTVTVQYIQRPKPVYSDYDMWRFQPQHFVAIYKYAAFLYKYRDMAPNFGNQWYQFFELQAKKAASALNKTLNRQGYKVNMKKRQ